MGGDFVGDHTLADIVLVGQAQVFFGSDIAEHGRSRFACQGCADGTGDMVVAGRNIGYQRPQHIKRGFVAHFALLFHIHFHQVHGHMARPFDHGLHAMLPGLECEFAQRFQLGELSRIVGIGQTAGAQAVSQAVGHIVRPQNLAQFVEIGVPGVLLVPDHHPLGDERTTPADNAGDPVGGQVQMLQQNARMDGHVVHPLLRLALNHIEKVAGLHVADVADVFHSLVHGHGADWHG